MDLGLEKKRFTNIGKGENATRSICYPSVPSPELRLLRLRLERPVQAQ